MTPCAILAAGSIIIAAIAIALSVREEFEHRRFMRRQVRLQEWLRREKSE